MGINDFISNIIFLLFPFAAYLLYLAYIKNMDFKEKSIFLELSLFTSLYLVLRTGIRFEDGTALTIFHMVLFNIPLIIAYLKKKHFTAVLISIIMIMYYYINLKIHPSILIIEYLMYFITYTFLIHKRPTSEMIIGNFVVIKTFILVIVTFTIFNPEGTFLYNTSIVLGVMSLFTLVAYIIIYFINVSEDVVNLNSTMSELEKEKQLRRSLFKLTHEIKNPIAVCKGYLDMFDYNDEVKIRKYIPIIKSEIERSIGLMDDFLDYTKVKVTKEEVDLYMLIEEVWDSTEALYKKHKIKGKIIIPDDELYLNLDYNRMKQVFVNLLKNSIEAKHDNKEMTLELRTIVKKDHVLITIKDNGKGMDKDTLANLGEMFFTTKTKGTGLGVSLSKEIIELHGGSIEYKSTLGKGTTVFIKLPCDNAL